jgi:hypothetical protein
MNEIEAELVKAAKFKDKGYDDRQDYLAALLIAMDKKISDDQYDLLSDEAVAWHVKAVEAKDNSKEIPDFEGSEIEDDEELPLTDPKHPLHRPSAEAEETEDDEVDPETVNPEPVEEDEEPVPAPKPKAKAKVAKAAKVEEPEEAEPEEPKAEKKPKRKIDYTTLTGEKDRYGIVKGTKTSEAVKLYEKGRTLAQVTDELGGRHYNILKRLTKDGHLVEKLEGGVWKITHKDDLTKKSKK